jgi:hypothetical protein
MAVMKKIYFMILSLLLTPGIFAQSGKEVNLNEGKDETHSSFNNRKEKGFYNIMQISLLFGSRQLTDWTSYNMPYGQYPSENIVPVPVYYHPSSRAILAVAPSFTLTNGYMFNEHWAAGAGVGFEIFDYNLFPLFAEVRYTLWDNKISPFMVVKGGYSFGGFKAKHYDELYLDWSPYYINDTRLRHNGGIMIHPEIGVKVPLSENSDLLFTAAYRYQKTKSVARKEYGNSQFDEWEHTEDINRLSFGLAIMFR